MCFFSWLFLFQLYSFKLRKQNSLLNKLDYNCDILYITLIKFVSMMNIKSLTITLLVWFQFNDSSEANFKIGASNRRKNYQDLFVLVSLSKTEQIFPGSSPSQNFAHGPCSETCILSLITLFIKSYEDIVVLK